MFRREPVLSSRWAAGSILAKLAWGLFQLKQNISSESQPTSKKTGVICQKHVSGQKYYSCMSKYESHLANVQQYHTLTDRRGERFGKLVIVDLIAVLPETDEKWREVIWQCKCDCGNVCDVKWNALRRGHTKTCGCREKERMENSPWYISIYTRYKDSAVKRSLPFELSYEETVEYFKSNCFYCGKEPATPFKKRGGIHFYTGIDRVDNDLGYLKDNCVPCCKRCNYCKKTLTADEYLSHCQKVVSHFFSKESSG